MFIVYLFTLRSSYCCMAIRIGHWTHKIIVLATDLYLSWRLIDGKYYTQSNPIHFFFISDMRIWMRCGFVWASSQGFLLPFFDFSYFLFLICFTLWPCKKVLRNVYYLLLFGFCLNLRCNIYDYFVFCCEFCSYIDICLFYMIYDV